MECKSCAQTPIDELVEAARLPHTKENCPYDIMSERAFRAAAKMDMKENIKKKHRDETGFRPIEVQVVITITAIVKGRSIETIERDCKQLKQSLIGNMENDEDTHNVQVSYHATEIEGD